jgi:hypothetical protein
MTAMIIAVIIRKHQHQEWAIAPATGFVARCLNDAALPEGNDERTIQHESII